MTVFEINDAAMIRDEAHEEAHEEASVIFWWFIDESMENVD